MKRRGTRGYVKKSRKNSRKEEIEKIINIKDDTEIWKYVRKERRNRVKIDESITLDKWKQHFMNLFQGKKRSRGEERSINVETKIKKVRESLRKFKNGIWKNKKWP